MDCNLKELVSMVKVTMDRNMDSTALETIGDVDTLAVNDISQQKAWVENALDKLQSQYR